MVFPEANILLVVRHPIQWLQSMYFFRLSLRFPETLDGFNPWVRDALDRNFLRTDAGQVQIGRLVNAYVDSFGLSRIRVLRYEDLVADDAGFIRTVSELFGIDAEITLGLYRGGEERQFKKLRITERQKIFFEKFKLVREGRYSEYLGEVEALLDVLGSKARERAGEFMQIDLAENRQDIEEKLKALSAFIDRIGRPYLLDDEPASAAIDAILEERVRGISDPGLRYIASELNSAVSAYFA